MAWDVGLDIEAAQSFVAPGSIPDLLRKLRRGDWVVQGWLDLHRHTQEEARSRSASSSRRHGARAGAACASCTARVCRRRIASRC
jgi:hypothetical protein